MKLVIKFILVFVLSFSLLPVLTTDKIKATQQNPLRIWYDRPSSQGDVRNNENNIWQRNTLPIGNGDMGANVYGEIVNERLTFNEKTLWSGGPSRSRPNYNGGNIEEKGRNGAALKEVQDLFRQGNINEGSRKAGESLIGAGANQGYGTYLSWGNIYFRHTDLDDQVSEYQRDLDLTTALSTVSFTKNNTVYHREFFISNPDDVLVAKFQTNGTGKLNVDITFPSNQNGTTVATNDQLKLSGEVSDNQLKYDSILKVIPQDGTLIANENRLEVRNASAFVVLLAAKTDYKNVYNTYRTGETAEQLSAKVQAIIDKATAKGYDTLKANHLSDYTTLFNRVALDLGQETSTKPTNQLLQGYKNNSLSEAEKRQLEVMMFQYGRYLTIASSRANSKLPSNLQGVWNNRNNPPWSSDYHINVNLQMNYWPTYVTNLTESAIPLIKYIDSLREPGRVTAKIYAGIESGPGEANGFMAHTQQTPFGWTTPGWQFNWGWSPASVPWIIQNAYEYFEYTNDIEFLKTEIYPMLREQAMLYNAMLIKDEDNKYISSPTYSPEHGPRTAGNTFEQSLIWQLFNDAIYAGTLLGEDEAVLRQWQDKLDNLKGPIEIGTDGQIKEWYHETSLTSVERNGSSHRHISHMLGLFPGDLITEDNPAYYNAARVSMENRVDRTTGWAMAQRVNTWARLGNGNRAYHVLGLIIKHATYQNLWDDHPPELFQIDGNFGYTSGVAEMLLQSNAGFVKLLPSLPDAWQSGQVKGLLARGNFEIDMQWSKGQIDQAKILSKNGGNLVLQFDGLTLATIKDENGQTVELEHLKENRVSFETEKGKTYFITNIPKKVELAPINNLTAYKLTSNRVDLSWDNLEDSGTYVISRQIADGNWVDIATVNLNSYHDTKAYDEFEPIKYRVRMLKDLETTAISNEVSVLNLSNMEGMIDDTDPRINYKGSWATWDRDPNYNNTIKYLQNPVGGEEINFTFYGTGIEVYTTKNSDRGKYHIYIDDEEMGEVDTYSSSQIRMNKIYEKTDLALGLHKIKLVATNTKNSASSRTKVEFDAFKVLNNQKPEVSRIFAATMNGLTYFNKPNSSVDLIALELAEDDSPVAYADVNWTLETIEGTVRATVNDKGRLSFNNESGKVAAVASLKNNPQVSSRLELTLAIPEDTHDVSYVDDANPDNLREKNPAIQYAGRWGNPYAGEPTKHFNTTKTETGNVGDSLTYSFEGTGIEVYAQKHANFAAYRIEIDNQVVAENVSLQGSSDGDPQSKIFEVKNLANTTHTIKLTVVARGNLRSANFDFFKIFKPKTQAVIDKTILQDAIEEVGLKDHPGYDEASYQQYVEAYQNAVRVMNDPNASLENARAAAERLKEANNNLRAVALEIAEDLNIDVIEVSKTSATLRWDEVAGADSYKIQLNDEEVIDVSNNRYTFESLTPNTNYTFKLKAVKDSLVSQAKTKDFKTLISIPELVITSASVNKDGNELVLIWDSQDVDGQEFIIYANGQRLVKTSEKTYRFVSDEENISFKIVARVNDVSSKPYSLVYQAPVVREITLLNDETTGITVNVEEVSGANALKLIVTPVVNKTIPNVNQEDIKVYDIEIVDAITNQKQVIDGVVNVKIPFDKEREIKNIYHLGVENELIEKYNLDKNDDIATVSFNTTHFSEYAIVFYPKKVNDNNDNNNTTVIVIDNNKPNTDVVVNTNTTNNITTTNIVNSSTSTVKELPKTGFTQNNTLLITSLFILASYFYKKKD